MKLIFILSGGLDSTTALYQLRQEHEVTEALSFDYGQRHKRELVSAKNICDDLKIPHQIIDLSHLNGLLQGSSLTTPGIETPYGNYKEETMKQTVVPNRNAIMINIAAGYAVSQKIYGLGLGVHAGDHYIYPDCRPEFMDSQQQTLSLANECNFKLLTPFLHLSKKEIVKIGHALGVPFEKTWTCYEGAEKPCSLCGSCTERIGSFWKNGLQDPLYSSEEWEECISMLRQKKFLT